MTESSVFDSPIGTFTLTATDGVLTQLDMNDAPKEGARGARRGVLAEATAQLEAYFDGLLQRFDLPLRTEGTDFQQRVWKVLLDIPFGETLSYGEVAERAGSPRGARPTGMACGRNPIAIVVPCHRVIGSAGSLTGYGLGLGRKEWLLAHEAGVVAGTVVTSLERTRGS